LQAQTVQHLQAVSIGQANVEQNDVKALTFNLPARLSETPRKAYFMSCREQVAAKCIPHRGVVVDDQNSARFVAKVEKM
jgi:hypothetical protein